MPNAPDSSPATTRAASIFVPPAAPAPVTGGATVVTPAEVGGSRGPDPTRYGDWERAGRCIDF